MNYKTILLHRSYTVDNVPDTSAVDMGEVSLNTIDGRFYAKQVDDNSAKLNFWTSNDRHIMHKNQIVIDEDAEVEPNYNSLSLGPTITITSDATVTVAEGSIWQII